MARRVAIVPHTHWDREWYEAFPTFRLRLVELVERLVPMLEADAGFTHFLLDGQLAAVDDVLEVRPELEDRIRRLVTAGRLAIGPWYTLPDEFLVSGETLIRNLQLGFERAASLGGAMEVGYLPDMFGHIAQMPQLLRLFGLEHAVVWRGVPAAVDRTGFWWEAPDGSVVRAEYLPQGYGNGARSPERAEALLARIRAWEREFDALLGDGPILWMDGSDHEWPQPRLPWTVAAANELARDGQSGDEPAMDLAITSLPAYLAEVPRNGLPRWRGELRSGARANLLMGVASNRVDVRQAVARAERALERLAEPLLALFAPADSWPQSLLDLAWREVIRNAAHDSVCACSADEVVDTVLQRYASSARTGEDLAALAMRFVGAQLAVQGPVAVNPSARARSGLVELRLPGNEPPEGTQLLAVRPGRRSIGVVPVAAAAEVLGEVVSWTSGLSGVSYAGTDGDDDVVDLVLHADGTLGEPATRAAVRARLEALAVERPQATVRAWLDEPPMVTVLARVDGVPGFGWRAWPPGPLDVEAAWADGLRLGNGLVTVAVDASDATFAIDDHDGLGRLVEGGDAGDTYNWCPPAQDHVVDRPQAVAVSVEEAGPLRARLRLEAIYRWPSRLDEASGRRVGLVEVPVVTILELHAGQRLVRVTVSFDHHVADHRLRAHFPLPEPASSSRAECAFAVVERGLDAEGGPTEAPLATYPSRRFVQAGGLTIVHDGLPEHELVERDGGSARELALTLVRATGYLSRGPMPTRLLPAGPVLPLRGAQVPGPLTLRYGVQIGEADPFALADDLLLPLLVAQAAGLGDAPPVHQALAVAGAEVSAVRRRPGGRLEVRCWNPTDRTTTVEIPGRHGWLVDLRDRPVAPFDGAFELGPWRIATAVVAG